MKSSFKSILDSLPFIAKFLLIVGVIVFIGFLFPDHITFKYNFEKGKTWGYSDLLADYDFSLLRTEEDIASEQVRIDSSFAPYYVLNDEVRIRSINQFKAELEEKIATVQLNTGDEDIPEALDRLQIIGIKIFNDIYGRGIGDILPGAEILKGSYSKTLNVIHNNSSRKELFQNLSTTQQAKKTAGDLLATADGDQFDLIYPILQANLKPNFIYSDSLTRKFKSELINAIPLTEGKVSKGELLIRKGELITEKAYQKLFSYKKKYEQEFSSGISWYAVFGGYILLTALIIFVFVSYLRDSHFAVFKSFSQLTFLFIWILLFSYMVYTFESRATLSSWLIPFCLGPILIKNFFNESIALFTHIIVILIVSFISYLGYEFTFLQIFAGIVAILFSVDTRDFNRFFKSILLIFCAYALGYFGLSLIKEGNLQTIDWSPILWLGINAILLLLAIPLIPLFERIFGFVSHTTLIELSDLNKPLLKDLALKAPGTLQHTLQVSNLSEAAATKVGANSLLVRVGALYHDIGKMLKPTHFIENQSERSPHDGLTNFESARIIIDHVIEGEKMAKKAKLPQVIIDFITTHHGDSRTEYFYRNQLKQEPDREFDENLFRYPGPKPTTREQTILMLADSIEAAAKSLKSPTEEDIKKLVKEIIQHKVDTRQLIQSELSIKDLNDCQEVFINTLKSIYHVRISYPEEVKKSAD